MAGPRRKKVQSLSERRKTARSAAPKSRSQSPSREKTQSLDQRSNAQSAMSKGRSESPARQKTQSLDQRRKKPMTQNSNKRRKQ